MADANAAFIGSIPDAYDRYLGPMLFAPYADDLASRLRAAAPRDVLEIAAGTGILTARLRALVPSDGTLTATDLNAPMLDHARGKLAGGAIAWRTADAQALPFGDRSFDAVACQFGVMFVPDKARAFAEARRVLRPGGRFAFNVWGSLAENPAGRIARDVIARFFAADPPTFYDVPFGFHDEARIRALLREAGFGEVRAEWLSLEARSPSARDAALGFVTGNPVVQAIRERATAPVERVVDAVAAALEAAGGAPLRLPTRALVLVAHA